MNGPDPQPPDDLNQQATLRDLSFDKTVKSKGPPKPQSSQSPPPPPGKTLDNALTEDGPDRDPTPPLVAGNTLKPGVRMFQRYRLVRFLGRGAMGLVWLARDEALEIDVALKFLPDALAGDKRSVHALKEEVKRARGLTHRNIIQVFDFNQDDERVGMSMEYVDGETLSAMQLDKERHPGGVFPLRVLRPWVAQLCEALEYAHHEARVVHRDLKPSNLMVSRTGHLKVADFGISRSIAECLTRTTHGQGTKVSGTPPYMSPEHLDGDKPHPANDVYSLGATLYELLSGQPPFSGGDIPTQIKSKKPPLLRQRREEWLQSQKVSLREKLPDEWEETIMDCLAKKAADRPQSAREVAERLGLVETPTGQPRRKRRLWPWALCAGLLMLLGMAGWLTARSNRSNLPSTLKATNGEQVEVSYRINDKPVSPTNVLLKPGPNLVVAERPDYEPTTNRLWLLPFTKQPLGSVILPGQRSTGTLQIKAPTGVSWAVESARGETNVSGTGPRVLVLPTGNFRIKATGPGASQGETVAVDRKATVVHELTLPVSSTVLVPISVQPDQSWAILDPQGAVVTNGTKVGNVLLDKERLYRLQVVLNGITNTTAFAPGTSGVRAPSRGNVRLTIRSPDAALDFRITPQTGAGEIVGVSSPTNFTLFADSYTVRAGNRYGSVTQSFTIEAGQTRDVSVTLPSAPPPPPPPVADPPKVPVPETGSLSVVTDPPDLRYSLTRAGGYQTSATSGSERPLTGLQPGRYFLHISCEFGSTNAETEVVAGQVAAVVLKFPYGAFELTSEPVGARVQAQIPHLLLPVGTSPYRSSALPAGSYNLKLEAVGYEPASCTVVVEAGRTNRTKVVLTRIEPRPSPGQPWRNSLGMEFTPVPGLDYLLFGKYEVRIADFQLFMKEEPGHQYSWPDTKSLQTNYPAARISWVMATTFCRWLTKKEREAGRIGTNQCYDLPSDYEWGLAAGLKPDANPPSTPKLRAEQGQADVYPFGTWLAQTQPPPRSAGNYNAGSEVLGDSFTGTSPVGSFLPASLFTGGPVPIYDLGGNVKEWVLDFYDADRSKRTLRGGSFKTGITAGLSSQREPAVGSNESQEDVGFRCVLVLDSNVMVDPRARDRAGRVQYPVGR